MFDFRLLRLSNEWFIVRIIDLNLNNRWAQWENRWWMIWAEQGDIRYCDGEEGVCMCGINELLVSFFRSF